MNSNVVLVVDDDLVTLASFKKLFNDNFPEVELITCQDSRQALDVFKNKLPAMVIMDIKMPYINGLDIIKDIMEVEPKTKVIVNSAYDYFEYAKKAIVLGVVDYILKPSSVEILTSTIRGCLDRIRAEEADFEKDHTRALLNREVIISIIYYRNIGWITANFEKMYGYPLCGICMEIEILNPKKFSQGLFNEKVKRTEGCIAYKLESSKYAVVMLNAKKTSQAVFAKEQQYFVNSLKGEFGDSVSVLTGKYFDDPEKAHESFIEVSQDMFRSKTIGKTSMPNQNQVFVNKVLNKSVTHDDCEDYFSFLYNTYGGALEFIRTELADFIFQIKSNFIKNSIEWFFINNMTNEVFILDDTYELKVWFFNSIDRIKKISSFSGGTKYSAILNTVLSYIDEHYCENISLADAAKLVHVSKEYLSQRFKKEMGVNFVNYVNKKKVDRSLILLRTTDKTVGDIAAEVGFDSISYYTRVFKKSFGRSPSEMRRQATSGQNVNSLDSRDSGVSQKTE